MELEQEKIMVRLLKQAVSRTIEEKLFWKQFTALGGNLTDPIAGSAHASALHYWGNFFERNLLLIPVKPDAIRCGKGKTNLI